jgi:regulator of replication initiation timing
VAEPLRVVDPKTGELYEPGESRAVHELRTRVAGLEADLEALQGENLRLIRANKALKRDRENERLRHRRRREVEAIWADWQAVTGQAKRKLSAERFDVIVARLNEGYEPGHFHLAAYGAVHNYPWTIKAGQSPLQEVATIASKGAWLESFALAGHEAKRR